MTLGESSLQVGFLENEDQLGWLGTFTSSSPSWLFELGIDQIYVQDSSWIKIISKTDWVSRIVLIRKLFLQMFWEDMQNSFKIMLYCCS